MFLCTLQNNQQYKREVSKGIAAQGIARLSLAHISSFMIHYIGPIPKHDIPQPLQMIKFSTINISLSKLFQQSENRMQIGARHKNFQLPGQKKRRPRMQAFSNSDMFMARNGMTSSSMSLPTSRPSSSSKQFSRCRTRCAFRKTASRQSPGCTCVARLKVAKSIQDLRSAAACRESIDQQTHAINTTQMENIGPTGWQDTYRDETYASYIALKVHVAANTCSSYGQITESPEAHLTFFGT